MLMLIILMKRIKTLKLLLATAVVDLVLQLDLWVRKCSNFISMIISNTLFKNLCSWEAYLEPCQFSMTELSFELWAKSCLFSQKISIIYVWKSFKYSSAAVSISCIVIKKHVKIKHTNTINLFNDFSGNTPRWNISLILIPYNSHKKK